MSIELEIGKRIFNARKSKGYTAAKLGELTGFNRARISNWENGRRVPSLECVKRLQEVLNVPAGYLLCMENISIDAKKNIEEIPFFTKETMQNKEAKINISVKNIPLNHISKNSFAFKLPDNSTGNNFKKDDVVIFDKTNLAEEGNLVLFSVKSTKQIFFRKFTIDNTNIDEPIFSFISFDPSIKPITTSSENSFHILGVCKNNFRITV